MICCFGRCRILIARIAGCRIFRLAKGDQRLGLRLIDIKDIPGIIFLAVNNAGFDHPDLDAVFCILIAVLICHFIGGWQAQISVFASLEARLCVFEVSIKGSE